MSQNCQAKCEINNQRSKQHHTGWRTCSAGESTVEQLFGGAWAKCDIRNLTESKRRTDRLRKRLESGVPGLQCQCLIRAYIRLLLLL